MIPASDDYRAALAADNRNFYCEAVITLYDETTLTVTNEHIWANGFRIKQAVSGKSSLEVGACIINELTLVLNNIDGDFDGLLFDGAKVVAKIGLYDADGQLIDIDGEGGTTLQKGEYYVDEVTGDETLITLTCLDAMANLDRDFAELAVVYPATLQSIVSAIASACSVRFTQLSFHNNSYIVTQAPDDAALTCRDALSMIAQIAGSYATIDRTGELTLAWFDTDFLKSAILDGGTYWHDIDDADGGSFWSGGDTYDGGGLYLSDFELTSGFYRFSRSITDLRITGVAVSDGETNHLAGDEGYTFQLRDNAFINPGDEATIASDLGARLIGMTFRPFEADHLPDPTLEPGDTIAITDRFGQRYLSMVTETEFSAWSRQKTACNAETPSRNASRRYLASEKAAAVEVKSYDKTVNAYVDFISNAYGMYRSQITDPDDATSQIYAFHDQSTMANSLFCVYEGAAGIKVGRRDSTGDAWTYTDADATDAVCLVRLLTANTAIINQLFAQDISVTGALHSTDYVPALPGASPPYSQAGMGVDFGDKEFEAENFAIDADGKVYAKAGQIGGWDVNEFYLDRTISYDEDNKRYSAHIRLQPRQYGQMQGMWLPIVMFEVCVQTLVDGEPQPSLWVPLFEIYNNGDVWLSKALGEQFEAIIGGTSAGADDVPFLAKSNSGSVGFRAARTDSTGDLFVGVGSGGASHGMWSNTLGKWMIYADASGVKVNGLADGIDTTPSYTSGGTVGTSNGAWKSVQSIQLSAGVWYVEFGMSFASNANGYRAMSFTGSSSAPSQVTRADNTMGAVSGEATVMNSNTVLSLNAAATYYLWAYQNSGGSLNTYPFIRATRIK